MHSKSRRPVRFDGLYRGPLSAAIELQATIDAEGVPRKSWGWDPPATNVNSEWEPSPTIRERIRWRGRAARWHVYRYPNGIHVERNDTPIKDQNGQWRKFLTVHAAKLYCKENDNP